MSGFRKWLFYLSLAVAALCFTVLIRRAAVTEYVRILAGIRPDAGYLAVGSGQDGLAAAVRRVGDTFEIRCFTESKVLEKWRVDLPEDVIAGTVDKIYAADRDRVYLSVYGEGAQTLYVYCLEKTGEAVCLLKEDCPGDSSSERKAAVSLSEFSCEERIVSFALITKKKIQIYTCVGKEGLAQIGSRRTGKKDILSVWALQDGTLVTGGEGFLEMDGESIADVPAVHRVTCLTRGRLGWYYIDESTLTVCFSAGNGGPIQYLFNLDPSDYATGSVLSGIHLLRHTALSDEEVYEAAGVLTDAAVTSDEHVWMLEDGGVLLLAGSSGTEEVGGILYPSRMTCILRLFLLAAASLFAALILWVLLCGIRRGYTSLAVYYGSRLIALTLLAFTILYVVIFPVWCAREEADDCRQVMESMVLSCLAEHPIVQEAEAGEEGTDAEMVMADTEVVQQMMRTLCRSLEAGERGYENVSASLVFEDTPVFARARRVLEDGKGFWLQGEHCLYAVRTGDAILMVQADGAQISDTRSLEWVTLGGLALVTLFSVLALAGIAMAIGRLSRSMGRIAGGDLNHRALKRRTGDELENLAVSVDSLADVLKDREHANENLEHLYRRFVPEKVLGLLGKQSIRDVDKHTCTVRKMTVMTVSFTFPDPVYTNMNNSKLLFDSVNDVIERTASIVSRKGGTVFNFAYNGFDVVMEENGGNAVSTAVAIQQEMLSLNESHAKDGLPLASLYIAVDVGNVTLGIVGDSTQMEPTTISSSFTVVRRLTGLCGRLQAGILCTESVISGQKDYGNRYMGKCMIGKTPVRVYEVFDGDEFRKRRGKSSTVRQFSQGVYDLYSGETTAAKRMFLQLSHNYPEDGGARYYLYLADRIERDPQYSCMLSMEEF